MSARGRFLSVLVSIVIALAGFVTLGALPAAAAPSAVQYVALGDSYAAGTAAGSFPDDCKQSTNGYPTSLLDLGSRIDLQANLACSGATTSAVVDNQLSALNSHPRLVTLTVGAADLDLSGVLTACTAVPPTPTDCLREIAEAGALLPAEPGDPSVLGTRLVSLFADVAEVAPRARVVVTGYPHLFEPRFPPDPTADIVALINSTTDRLNIAIEQAVSVANDADVNIYYVDVTEEFAGHGIPAQPQLPQPPPLFIYPAGPEVFHPTAEGYDAYADAISAALPRGWLDKQKQSV
jgi:lysophospholipase L1-like esterase